jgi:hypothetical protein
MTRRGRSACTCLWTALLLTRCASSPMSAKETIPATAADGQREIEELSREIERNRAALGLLPRLQEPAERRAPEAPSSGGTRLDVPRAPALAPAPVAAEARVSATDKKKRDVDEESREGRCKGPCRYTRAICSAADRICALSRFLADDDSRRRCDRARRDCQEARQVTRDSCPGC